MGKLLAMTKESYVDLVDLNGELYSRPQGRIGKRQLKNETIKFLQDYVLFIMSSRIVSETTKMYIRSSSGSITAAIKSYNDGLVEKERVNLKTAQSKVDYDRKKLLGYFPEDMLYNVIYHSDCDLIPYKRMLSMARQKYSKEECLSEKLVLNLSKKSYCTSLTEEEFNEMVELLVIYSKNTVKEVEEKRLSADMTGYFNHLQFADVLSEVDEKRLQQLKMLL